MIRIERVIEAHVPEFTAFGLNRQETSDTPELDIAHILANTVSVVTVFAASRPVLMACVFKAAGKCFFCGCVDSKERGIFSAVLKYSGYVLDKAPESSVYCVCSKKDSGTILTLGKLNFMIIAEENDDLFLRRDKGGI